MLPALSTLDVHFGVYNRLILNVRGVSGYIRVFSQSFICAVIFFLHRKLQDRPVGRAVMRCLWSGRSKVYISDRSNRTQCCQRLATVALFLRKKLHYPGAITWRWASQTGYTLRRITAIILKDLI